jgi:hypothetical protein
LKTVSDLLDNSRQNDVRILEIQQKFTNQDQVWVQYFEKDANQTAVVEF